MNTFYMIRHVGATAITDNLIDVNSGLSSLPLKSNTETFFTISGVIGSEYTLGLACISLWFFSL